MDILGEAGIGFAGAGRNLAEARTPHRGNRGLRIAFLAYTEMWFVYTREPHNWADRYPARGCAGQADLVKEDVRSARKQADVVVVSFHWDRNTKKNQPRPSMSWGGEQSMLEPIWSLDIIPTCSGVEFYKGA